MVTFQTYNSFVITITPLHDSVAIIEIPIEALNESSEAVSLNIKLQLSTIKRYINNYN